MQAINPKESRSAEYTQESAKTDGMSKGGSVSSASKRADGIAMRGKTRGKMC